MPLLQSSTDTFWAMAVIAFTLGFVKDSPLSGVGIVAAFSNVIGLPLAAASVFLKASPLIAIPAVFAFLYFMSNLKNGIGEGYHVFALFAFFAVIMGV